MIVKFQSFQPFQTFKSIRAMGAAIVKLIERRRQ